MEQLKLPVSLVSKGDVQRLLRELNALNDFFVGAAVRQPGQAVVMPKTSKILEQLAADNQRNLFEEPARKQLFADLENLVAKAPDLHISFATEPSPRALEPLIRWMRENLHPQVLLSVGYQPAIAAGCVLRTPNKVFDMSMGAHLRKQTPLLMKFLAGSINGS